MVEIGHDLSDTALAVTRVDYHGWQGCYVVTNGIAEAVIVSAIGRVMQFRFAGSDRGVLWENRQLNGMLPQAGCEWMNFGGDKAWPAPQENWESVTGRAWPPPTTFDSAAVDVRVHEYELTLTSSVDPNYGVWVCRRVSLKPDLPVMTIATRYCKVAGSPIDLGAWVVTQLRDPQRVFVLLPQEASKVRQIRGPAPNDLRRDGRLLSLIRDPDRNTKTATDGHCLLWVGDEDVLRIDGYSASATGNTCSSAVYTNMDPLQYVELETESRVTRLAVGDHLDLTNVYTLAHRSLEDTTAEARRCFGLHRAGVNG